MKGVRFSREELKSRLGLSERLAIRIGALLSRGVEFTCAVLEEIAARKELQTLVLAPTLLEQAEGLTTEILRNISPDARDLIVSGKVIALEEERLAEQAWTEEPGKELPAVPMKSILNEEEARQLFPSQDLGKLKLTLLTGVGKNEKIEALRRLAYAPLAQEEKGALALRALSDAEPDVRAEAAGLLRSLGLQPELAEALGGVATGTSRQRLLALEKIESLAGRLKESEQRIAVSSLVSSLRQESEATVLSGLLRALRPFAPCLCAQPESVGILTRQLVRLLIEHFDRISSPARSLVQAIGAGADRATTEAIWKEVELLHDRRLRNFFFAQICRMPDLGGEFRRVLAERLAEIFVQPGVEDFEFRGAMEASRELGDDMVEALLCAMDASPDPSRTRLVSILDDVACAPGVSAEVRERVAERLLDLLRKGDRTLRASILETRIWYLDSISEEKQITLGGELIGNLHAYQADRFHDLTTTALRRLGDAAIAPLQEAVRVSPHSVERETAVRLLGEIAGRSDQKDLIPFLRSMEDGDRVSPGVAMRAVARACLSPGADAGEVKAVFSDYRKKAVQASSGFDVLVALSTLSAAPVADPGTITETVLQIVDFLMQPFPDPDVKESSTQEGTVLTLGPQTSVYTELIPELLQGLHLSIQSGRLRPRILVTILDQLLDRFQSVSEYREIWAPGNVVLLSRVLAILVQQSGMELSHRLRLLDAMLPASTNLSISDIISRFLNCEEETDSAYRAGVERFVMQMFSLLQRPSYQEAQDQNSILLALGRVTVNGALSENPEKSASWKERILEQLMERNVLQTLEGRGVRETLLAAKHIPDKLKERLSRSPQRRTR